MRIIKNKLVLEKEGDFECEKLNSASLVYNFLREKIKLHKEPEEVVIMLALNSKKRLVSCCEVARGSIEQSQLIPRDIFKRALVANATAIIIAHNHPSGIATPSNADELTTIGVKKVGDIMNIKLLDHIIVGEKDYYSFYEENPQLLSGNESIDFYKQYKEVKKTLDERSI